jgi:hypothetical protein
MKNSRASLSHSDTPEASMVNTHRAIVRCNAELRAAHFLEVVCVSLDTLPPR